MSSDTISVLLSVYNRENPDYFRMALQSIANQTLLPEQFVIVSDGKLTNELDAVLNKFVEKYSLLFKIKIVRLKRRVNLGVALNEGFKYCNCQLIARMDSDDYALPDRFLKQVKFFKNNASVEVLGGIIQEFVSEWDNPSQQRKVPLDSDSIKKFSRLRNPMNHMTIMIRQSTLERFNGYRDILGFEDYELWLRILKYDSTVFANIPDVLVAARISGLQNRRGGWKYVKNNFHARTVFYQEGLITFTELAVAVVVGTLVSLSPRKLRTLIYKSVLRKK